MKAANRPRYADVAPAVPVSPNQSQTYTYRVPASQPAPAIGTLVTIPFGQRRISGTVLATHHRTPAYAVRPLARVEGSTLSARQIAFAQQIAAAAHGGLGFTLRLFRPPVPGIIVPPGPSRRAKGQPSPSALLLEASAAARRRAVFSAAARLGRAQTLVLLPEIWMAAAWAAAGARILHTELSRPEQAAVWQAVAAGEPGVIAGTQKACYLPWKNLKLIVLEEEQFPAHKLWEQYPRLDNRIAAQLLASIHGADRLMSSSYPSLAARRVQLEHPSAVIRNRPLSLHYTFLTYAASDRQERRILPEELRQHIAAWHRRGERILLFISRRAARRQIYAELPRSIAAGITVNTSALFTAHPDARFERIVWLQPEQAASFPDYRSYDRARVTLARLHSLRTSRRQAVVLATRQLDTVQQVFAAEEIWSAAQLTERRMLRLPPYTDLVRVTITAANEKLVAAKAARVQQELAKKIPAGTQSEITLFGPFASAAARRTPERHLLLQGPLNALIPLYSGIRDLAVADVMPEVIV